MIRPALSHNPILRRRLPSPLQKFLQRRLSVRIRNPRAAFLQRPFEQRPLQHLAAPLPAHYPDKSPQSPLRTHPPAAPACPARRSSLPRAPAAKIPRDATAAPPTPAPAHSQSALGFSKAAPRSNRETPPANARSRAYPEPRRPKTQVARCLVESSKDPHRPDEPPATPESPSYASAHAPTIPLWQTGSPSALRAARVCHSLRCHSLQQAIQPARPFLIHQRKRAHFGALSCVELAFFAVSIPFLQFACSELWIAAHFVNAAVAASKCDAFSFANPSKYRFTGSGSE